MISISASATSAVRVLNSINRELDVTQNRITTGYKVNSAKDNASVWSTATALRSDIKSYDGIRSGLTSTTAMLDAAAAGASDVVDLLGELKTQITIASSATSTSSADYLSATAQIGAIKARITSTLSDSMSGTNLLNNGTTAVSYRTGTTTSGSVTVLDLDAGTSGMLGEDLTTTTGVASTSRSILTFLNTALRDATDTAALQAGITAAITTVTNYASTLGAASTNIAGTQSLLDKISDIKKSAVASLLDADLGEESARLQALQVKQQLATQALSIANSSAQNVLRLFQ